MDEAILMMVRRHSGLGVVAAAGLLWLGVQGCGGKVIVTLERSGELDGGAGAGGMDASAGGEAGAGASAGDAGLGGGAGDGQAGASGSGGVAGQAGSGQDAGEAGEDAGGCETGQPCDGGVCAGGVCCAPEAVCAGACCGSGQLCLLQGCVTPGADCVDGLDCAAGQVCELLLGESAPGPDGGLEAGCVAGAVWPTGKCLPRPTSCEPGAPLPEPWSEALPCVQACQWKPSPKPFAPELRYAWGGKKAPPYDSDVMMSPIVIQLDDDDCDGVITSADLPELVFSTFSGGAYGGAGVTHAVSVVAGELVEKWAVPGMHPTKQLAGGNIDGVAGNEVVGCGEGQDGGVRALRGDGTLLWATGPMRCFMPSLADLDGDGTVEVVVEDGILDGATGAVEALFSEPLASSFVVVDADGDGVLDVVTGSQLFDAKGQRVVDTGVANDQMFYGTQDWKSPWPAVADLDGDGKPEIVVVDNVNHALVVWRYDAAAPGKFVMVRPPMDINGPPGLPACAPGVWGHTHGGGPPTLADLNGDGTPDVALASGAVYVALDGKKLMDPTVQGAATYLWVKETIDCSSASTSSTVFDFDGDGRAEVVYSDEERVRVYDGETGEVLWERCNTTATLIESPVVADVDNDGHADIVVVSNSLGFCDDGASQVQSGVRIFGAPQGGWVRTRRVWNQHGYHVTNVDEDGTIPVHEAANHLHPGLNNFRQNKQPGREFAAPDAIVRVQPVCGSPYGISATVRNVGEAALPAGVAIGFYKGAHPAGELLGKAATSGVLHAGQSESVVLWLGQAPGDVADGTTPVYGQVDDTSEPHPGWAECRTDNNVSEPVSGSCAEQ